MTSEICDAIPYHLFSPRGESADRSISCRLLSSAPTRGREHWRALGEKGFDALLDIRAGKNPMAVGEGTVDRLLRCLVQRIADTGANEAQSQRGATGQRLGESDGSGQDFTRWCDSVDQPNAVRLACVDELAGVEQLISLGGTHEAGQSKDAPASREDSEFHFGKADARISR